MFDWVGGITSEMSAVGLLPAALQGIDIRQMLAGASFMDGATRTKVYQFCRQFKSWFKMQSKSAMQVGEMILFPLSRISITVKNNPAALLALCWYWASDGVASKDMIILPYKDSLLLFSCICNNLIWMAIGSINGLLFMGIKEAQTSMPTNNS
ncbi:glucose-6-phosphate isomerase 1, chloroplastic-like isoform X2 [Eucalyptus grandis]|uniref:glucose-6-phosphate isomerase 1, chloroplastic-like isoform X2 n=1 Tax=Eucalyptus grandis TaxID=71139 RepID=UPI00192E7BD5|nr:glucose-6-phosphate isomerase 1, chloroplastic-like isoform X2 [Eucalyptus grandis]